MTEETKKKLKRGFEIVWHIVSAGMNIISFIVAIISAAKGDFNLAWQVVITIIIADSGLLVVFSVYATVLWHKVVKIENEDRKELSIEIEKINTERKEISSIKKVMQNNITFLEKCIDFSQELNTQCVKQLNKAEYDMRKCIDKIAMVANGNDSFIKKDNRIMELLEKLKSDANEHYDAFFRDCTEKLKTILDEGFKNKELKITNSISIKQFNSSLFWLDKSSKERAINNARIITTFRDVHTYSQYNREVGKMEYSISGNSDFSLCLNKPHYRNNTIGENDVDTYLNENANFISFYNRTIVVPIFVPEAYGKRYYGYLTADTLDTDCIVKEVYDMQMVKIMKEAASVIAIYFNIMEQHWGDSLNTIKEIVKCLDKPKSTPMNIHKCVDLNIEFLAMVYDLKHRSTDLSACEVNDAK